MRVLKPISPMDNVTLPKPINALEGIQLPEFPLPTSPNYGITHRPGKRYYPQNFQTPEPSSLADYNNYKELNSVADVILTTFNKNMERSNWFGLERIPILNIATGMAELSWTRFWKPLSRGEGGTVLLNALTGFGETLDVHFNPLKGFYYGMRDGGFAQALKNVKAATVGDERGRVNFDINTGNFLSDVALEVVLDPLNWVSFGGKALVKTGGMKFLQPALESIVKESASSASKTQIKTAAKNIMRAVVNNNDKAIKQGVDSLLSTITKTTQNVDTLDAKALADSMMRAVNNSIDASNLNAIQRLTNVADTLENVQFKAALSGSGFAPAWWIGRKGKAWVDEAIKARTQVAANVFRNYDGTLDVRQYDQAQTAAAKNTMGMETSGMSTPELVQAQFQNSIIKEKKKL